ncbi:MAG: ABC transporter substrate-binding protein, partial [Candidatus Thorarchaeota archaeon]
MDVDWLGYAYWGDYSRVPGWNFARFNNATFDAWRDQLLRSIDYEEVREAAEEMQKIWVYECPEIICYENNILSAYRTDRFVGFVEDMSIGVPGWWTYYKTQLLPAFGGPFGGTLRTTMSYDIQTFNFMMMPIKYPLEGMLYMMYDSLLKPGPDGIDIPWLAESYLVESHADNPSVPEGYTQVTFDIRQNVTWSDGTPLTADDVSYSINYYRETKGPYGPDLWNMTQAVMMTPYKVRFHFNTESIWHLHAITYKPILPKHIFVPQVGYDGWDEWNPLPGDVTLVTSGPFLVNEYKIGSHVLFSYNSKYFFGSGEGPDPTDTANAFPVEPVLLVVGISIGTIVIFSITRRR